VDTLNGSKMRTRSIEGDYGKKFEKSNILNILYSLTSNFSLFFERRPICSNNDGDQKSSAQKKNIQKIQ